MRDPDTILNWRRIDARVTSSGQPTEPQLTDIARLGVRHVINLGLHTHADALPDEPGTVAGLGMNYIHIPVVFTAPSEADFDAFCAAYERTGDEPTHVHCIYNWRVSAFFYRYRRDVLGMADAAARAHIDPIWCPHGVWAAFITPPPRPWSRAPAPGRAAADRPVADPPRGRP